MDARRFIDASLAPDRSHVAFSTLGIVHGMLGILTLKTGKVRVLAGFFEGYADEIAWSPNGRFVAVTDYGPSGLREIQVYNVQTAVAAERLGLVLEQRFMRRDLEVYRPLWSPDGTRVRFSVLALNRTPADRSQAWEIRLNGTGLRRLK
jgi:Tol biopolymer transport system component